MGYAVERLVLHAVRGNPERAYLRVVVAAVGSALERVVEHHHHAPAVGFGAGLHPFQVVVIEIVELLEFRQKVGEVDFHIVAVEVGSLGEIRAEFLSPEKGYVFRKCHPLETPFALRVVEIHRAEVVGDVDSLAFVLHNRILRNSGIRFVLVQPDFLGERVVSESGERAYEHKRCYEIFQHISRDNSL